MLIIIQARKNSKRMPEKVVTEFDNGFSLVEYIADICGVGSVIAIPDNEDWQYGETFKGHPTDLVKRFISCAEYYHEEDIIRVCGDSPFIIPELLYELSIEEDADYIGYEFEGRPCIQMGIGIYPERTTLTALKRLDKILPDNHPSREHCTEGLYSRPNEFNIKWLSGKLSIDTQEEFDRVNRIL